MLATPLAAWLVARIPAPVLGSAVGGVIVLTNTRTILRALDVLRSSASTTIYLFIVGVWVASVAIAIAKLRNGEFEPAAVDENVEPADSDAEAQAQAQARPSLIAGPDESWADRNRFRLI